MTPIKIALLGVGKIARDQHVPALSDSSGFTLAAAVSRSGGIAGIDRYPDIDALLSTRSDIAALSLCMPPQPRFDIARKAIMAGKHTMLEKPPGASVSEAQTLEELARQHGVTLFATWHSRYAAGVAAAREWLADKRLTHVDITWKEDVRRWHPGQDWIWAPGGFGVFDPGINALSIMTEILPVPVHVTDAALYFPENRATPIAADLMFAGPDGLGVSAAFDWRQDGPQTWDITVSTDAGVLNLSDGGATLQIDGVPTPLTTAGEYPALYKRFAELVATGQSDVDLRPLQHVADAFMLGRRETVEAFHD